MSRARIKELATHRILTKLLHEGALAQMSECLTQKADLSVQGAKVREYYLTMALDVEVVCCNLVVAERDEAAIRYRQVLSFLSQHVKAQEDRNDGALDTIKKLRKLYEEGWCVFASVFATFASEPVRRVVKLSLALIARKRKALRCGSAGTCGNVCADEI